jgi:ribosomal protein S18 acetylase RimI-like enzyme
MSRELALRLDAAEAEFNVAKFTALKGEGDNHRGVEIKRFGPVVVTAVRGLARNPSYNRVFCFTDDETAHAVEIIAWFRERKVRIWFDIVPPLVSQNTLRVLDSEGLCLSRFTDIVYAEPLTFRTQPIEGLTIEQIGSGQSFGDFAQVLSLAFDIPMSIVDQTAQFTAVEYSDAKWRRYLAFMEGQPASLACMYVGEKASSLAVMGTVPRYRNRGCQTALLRQCLADAAEAGSELIVSQTGSGSTSERNMIRAGFQVAYTKMLWTDRDTEVQ